MNKKTVEYEGVVYDTARLAKKLQTRKSSASLRMNRYLRGKITKEQMFINLTEMCEITGCGRDAMIQRYTLFCRGKITKEKFFAPVNALRSKISLEANRRPKLANRPRLALSALEMTEEQLEIQKRHYPETV